MSDICGAYASNGNIAAKMDDSWCLIDKGMNKVVNLPDCDYLIGFSEDNISVFRKNGKYGYIDSNGIVLKEPRYLIATPFVENVAMISKEDGVYELVDKNHQRIGVEKFDSFKPSNCDGFIVKSPITKKWGILNFQGDYIFKPDYDYVSQFKGGTCIVKSNQRYILLDSDEKSKKPLNLSGKLELSDNGKNMIWCHSEDEVGYINRNGQWIFHLDQAAINRKLISPLFYLALSVVLFTLVYFVKKRKRFLV